MAEHWRGTPRDLWGFQVTESALWEADNQKEGVNEEEGETSEGRPTFELHQVASYVFVT